MLLKHITFVSLFLCIGAKVYAYPDTACVEWFKKEKIDIKSKNCESDCSVTMVDMARFQMNRQTAEEILHDFDQHYFPSSNMLNIEKAIFIALQIASKVCIDKSFL